MIDFRMRKFAARLALPFVTIWLSVMPVTSYALLPAAIAPIVYGGAASAGGTAVGSGAAGWGLLLGLGFAFVGVGDARLPLTSDPSLAVPPPDAAPTAAIQPGGVPRCYIAFVQGGSSDILESPTCSGGSEGVCLALSGMWLQPYCYIGSKWGQKNDLGVSSPSCPAGYVVDVSGSSCVLSDPRAASPDNNCDYTRSGSALAVLSDPDCGGGAQLMNCNADGSVCTQTGTNPVTGQPRTIEIRTNPGGGSTIIQRDENLIGNTTVTDSTTVTISPSGTVDSVAGETTSGPLPTPGTAPSGAPVQPVEIIFPSDYARTGEAQTAANTLAPKIDRIGDALTTTTATTDPVEPLAADMPWFGTTFSGLTGWTLPGHVSTCPTPSLDLSMVLGAGHVYVMQDHCALIQNNQASMRAAAIAGWLILALFVFLRA